MSEPDPRAELGRERALARLAAAAVGVALALAAALVALLSFGEADPAAVGAALSDRQVRRLALEHLIEEGSGIWDAHPDADVGKLMQPDLRRRYRDVPLHTNQYGLRERPFHAEKPPGVVRVVLLGDSYVFGYGIEEKERVGAHLERALNERQLGDPARVECLHLGVPSWNVASEAAFLRRQLSQLRPDLVVHVIVPNDLGDTSGVRGFGAAGTFTPQHRQRCDARVSIVSHATEWGRAQRNPLPLGIDGEGRARMADIDARTARLAAAVEAVGGRYLLVAKWAPYLSVVREKVVPSLDDARIAYVSRAFTMDRGHWVGPGDRHWNDLASERVAMMLYAEVRKRGLLPALELARWDEAERWAAEIHGRGAAEASEPGAFERELAGFDLRSVLSFSAAGGDDPAVLAPHVYAGVSPGGILGPYASMVLARRGDRLALEAARLGAPELAGAFARVWVDEIEVGRVALDGERAFTAAFDLPAELEGRPFVNVRIESEDWIHRWDAGYRCYSLVLFRIGIVASRGTTPEETAAR